MACNRRPRSTSWCGASWYSASWSSVSWRDARWRDAGSLYKGRPRLLRSFARPRLALSVTTALTAPTLLLSWWRHVSVNSQRSYAHGRECLARAYRVPYGVVANCKTPSLTTSTSACLHYMGCKLAVPTDGKLTWTYMYFAPDCTPYAESEQQSKRARYDATLSTKAFSRRSFSRKGATPDNPFTPSLLHHSSPRATNQLRDRTSGSWARCARDPFDDRDTGQRHISLQSHIAAFMLPRFRYFNQFHFPVDDVPRYGHMLQNNVHNVHA